MTCTCGHGEGWHGPDGCEVRGCPCTAAGRPLWIVRYDGDGGWYVPLGGATAARAARFSLPAADLAGRDLTAEACMAEHPAAPWHCTQDARHDGVHVATGAGHTLARWK